MGCHQEEGPFSRGLRADRMGKCSPSHRGKEEIHTTSWGMGQGPQKRIPKPDGGSAGDLKGSIQLSEVNTANSMEYLL